MTILNTIELTTASYIPIVVGSLLIGSIFCIIPFANKIKTAIVSFIFIIYCFLALLIGMMLFLTGNKFQEPTGEYQYEVIFEDDVSFAEVIKKYDIIEQRGEIFVVEERENE